MSRKLKIMENEKHPLGDLTKTKSGQERTQYLNKKFFLNCDNDFVDIIGYVDSPWIEHLVQNFSNTFARIGVNTLPKSKLSDFSDKYQVF